MKMYRIVHSIKCKNLDNEYDTIVAGTVFLENKCPEDVKFEAGTGSGLVEFIDMPDPAAQYFVESPVMNDDIDENPEEDEHQPIKPHKKLKVHKNG